MVDVGRPEAMAVDWITDNVYFYSDNRPYAIKVTNMIRNNVFQRRVANVELLFRYAIWNKESVQKF